MVESWLLSVVLGLSAGSATTGAMPKAADEASFYSLASPPAAALSTPGLLPAHLSLTALSKTALSKTDVSKTERSAPSETPSEDCPTKCVGVQQPPEDTVPVPAGSATEPDIVLTAPWLAALLVPSTGVAGGDDGLHLRLGWQLSPVLYSFGIDPRLSPYRFFVAEPIVRHSGSLELVFMPQYVAHPDDLGDRFGFSAGLRGSLGVIERGDYLSLSAGVSYLRLDEGWSPEFEAGAYALFGYVGLVFQWAPLLDHTRWTGTFRIRFF